ncbi:hypothetical protein JR316_0007924 [Psilocybe cubensis]|uniref:Uncharacterized protein n=2 Tax=Psilocybe cubensis TaxID=181762 RepID=A0ACB8GUR1_PSICU|nr:hypothetical protein JR316_0007924 [Psilocybe cubensis]KAH9479334.1 hypothetical protein JR316_0007924 [Psilocybe cubensis]
MGRALFSLAYATPAPVIRTEPEPEVDICERWSAWNRFDPDSDDFFEHAEYEAFVGPSRSAAQEAAMPPLVEADAQLDSPESTENSVNEQGSPMAVGSDDPAILIADAYSIRATTWGNDEEDSTSSPTEAEWREADLAISSSPTDEHDQTSIPPFIPPVAFREASPALETVSLPSNDPPRSPTLRRAVNITPIIISRTQTEAIDRSPSPDSPSMPSTPPSGVAFPQALLTPSPPPSVTPRIYSWQRHSIPSLPSSPSLLRGNRDGLLTNPHARMSFARIDSSPARIRIPSGVM